MLGRMCCFVTIADLVGVELGYRLLTSARRQVFVFRSLPAKERTWLVFVRGVNKALCGLLIYPMRQCNDQKL